MRKKVSAIFLLVAVFVVMALLNGMIQQKGQTLAEYQQKLAAHYTHSLQELTNSVEQIAQSFAKRPYLTEATLHRALYADVYDFARTGTHALHNLPFDPESMLPLASFFERLAQAARDNCQAGLDALSNPAARLAAQFAQNCPGNAPRTTADFRNFEESLLRKIEFAELDTHRDAASVAVGAFDAVSVEDAKSAAAAFTDLPIEIFSHSLDDKAGTHQFTARVDGGTFLVAVSRETGRPIHAENCRIPRTSHLTTPEALTLAAGYLQRGGYANMQLDSWDLQEHQLVAEFLHTENGIVYYPDRIEITTALDNGRILRFDAANHHTNHRPRTLTAPAFTAEDAKSRIPDTLRILDSDLALIEIGEHEILTHRFRVQSTNGNQYAIYLNAATGAQEKFQLL